MNAPAMVESKAMGMRCTADQRRAGGGVFFFGIGSCQGIGPFHSLRGGFLFMGGIVGNQTTVSVRKWGEVCNDFAREESLI